MDCTLVQHLLTFCRSPNHDIFSNSGGRWWMGKESGKDEEGLKELAAVQGRECNLLGRKKNHLESKTKIRANFHILTQYLWLIFLPGKSLKALAIFFFN